MLINNKGSKMKKSKITWSGEYDALGHKIPEIKKVMYRGKLETPSTIKADKKHREQLIEILLKGVNILRDGNDIDFALGFVTKRLK